MSRSYEFAELDTMSMSEIDAILEDKRKELVKAKQEKYTKIGQVLFYQTAIEDERA